VAFNTTYEAFGSFLPKRRRGSDYAGVIPALLRCCHGDVGDVSHLLRYEAFTRHPAFQVAVGSDLSVSGEWRVVRDHCSLGLSGPQKGDFDGSAHLTTYTSGLF
jgi:hypothetical protein